MHLLGPPFYGGLLNISQLIIEEKDVYRMCFMECIVLHTKKYFWAQKISDEIKCPCQIC